MSSPGVTTRASQIGRVAETVLKRTTLPLAQPPPQPSLSMTKYGLPVGSASVCVTGLIGAMSLVMLAPVSTWVLVSVSGVLGLFAGSSATGQWRNFMLWRNGVPFGQKDAFYNKDIGFYVFDLPWLHYVTDSVMAMTFIGLLVSATTHYLYGGIRLQESHDRLSGAAQVQLSALLGVFVLAKAVDYWLDRYDLVTDTGRLITGMTYTDDHAVLPAKSILMFIALICAVLFFLNMWRRTWLLPSGARKLRSSFSLRRRVRPPFSSSAVRSPFIRPSQLR